MSNRTTGAAALLTRTICVFAILPLLAEFLRMPSLVMIGNRILIYAIAALSVDFLLGFGGMASLGHAAFFGIGGYVVGILSYHAAQSELLLGVLPGTNEAWISWPIAMFVAAICAAGLGALSLRTKGLYFLMITFSFAQIVYFIFVALPAYGGDDGLSVDRNTVSGYVVRNPLIFYYLTVAVFIVVTFLFRRLTLSRFGFALQGIKQNDQKMRALGLPIYRYQLVAFIISGAVAGLAGALMVNLMGFVSPTMLRWTQSAELLTMVILGGAGTLTGAILGAAGIVVIEWLLSAWTEDWTFWFGLILVLIALFARRGLAGVFSK